MPGAARITPLDTSEAVERFMSTLEHLQREQVARLRALLLASAPQIAEGITWNAPSFRTTGYFATINLRYQGGIAVIFHLGARAQGREVAIPDPTGLLVWLGRERAALPLAPSADPDALAPALGAIVRAWIAWV